MIKKLFGSNTYNKLLSEAKSRIREADIYSKGETAKSEMEKAKDILISNGYDLSKVNTFNEELNRFVAEEMSGYSL